MKDATTSSFKDKKKNPDYFTATNQFLLHSWHELPGNSDKDKYMNPTCLVRLTLCISSFCSGTGTLPVTNWRHEEKRHTEHADAAAWG